MQDRKKLQEELNRINNLYQEYDTQMKKAGASIEDRQKMRDLMNAKKNSVISQMGDDLQKLNLGQNITVPGASSTKGMKDIAGQGMEAAQDILPSNIIKKVGKKMLGAIPVIGAGASAIMGEDAMAAVPGLGEAENVGESSEDEAQLISEIKAKDNYGQSQARLDKLKMLLGKNRD